MMRSTSLIMQTHLTVHEMMLNYLKALSAPRGKNSLYNFLYIYISINVHCTHKISSSIMTHLKEQNLFLLSFCVNKVLMG